MSIMGAQIDELRRYANRADGTFPMLARALRDAADTICELRGALQVARVDYRHLSEENAKLRELVRDMWRFTGAACKKYPRLFDPAAQGGQTVQLNAIDAFEQRMRELGITGVD